MNPKARLALMLAVLLAALAVTGLRSKTPVIPMQDFVEYASAAQAMLAGRDPYDPAVLKELQEQMLGESRDEPIMMWNPPWTLPVVAWLGVLPPALGHLLFLMLQIGCVLGSAAMLLQLFRVRADWHLPGFILAAVFSPFFYLIWFGQISGLLLLGLSGYLYGLHRGRYFTAGFCAALTSLKPHLLFGFGLLLIIDAACTARGRRVLLGGITALAGSFLLAVAINPDILNFYWQSISQPSTDIHRSVRDWYQPLISFQIRKALEGPSHTGFWIQFVPMAVASVVMAVQLFRRRIDPVTATPWVVLASALLTPYGGWPFDLVVLLVPVFAVYAVLSKAELPKGELQLLGGLFLIVNLVLSMLPSLMIKFIGVRMKMHDLIVMTPIYSSLMLLTLWRAKVDRHAPAAAFRSPLQAVAGD